MKKIVLIASFLIAFQCRAQSPVQHIADSIANAYLDEKTGALVIGIYSNGREKIFYYGETEKGNHILPDSNSIFEIGSITEVFTCLLYADLTVKGVIHADDALQKYLPVDVPSPVYQNLVCRPTDKMPGRLPVDKKEEPFISPKYTSYTCVPDSSSKPQPILLCYLATHTSGLPRVPSNLKKNRNNPYGDYDKDDLYEFLRSYSLKKPIGFDYAYSPLGISLLGHAMTIKRNQGFESLLEERILSPMKMTSTTIHIPFVMQSHILTGHDSKGNVAHHWTYDIMAPSGALNSSPADMMLFLKANLSMEKNYYSNLLDYTHNPRIKLSNTKSDATQIALGWKISSLTEEKNIVWQDGITGGFSSFIGFEETTHTGVVILSSISKSVTQTGIQFLKKLEKIKADSPDISPN